jgi:hypothetical protein
MGLEYLVSLLRPSGFQCGWYAGEMELLGADRLEEVLDASAILFEA